MPWCPKCGSEYRSDIERCSDCDEPLVLEEPSRVSEPAATGRRHLRYPRGLRVASEPAGRAWRMRAFWLLLGALAVVQAVPPTLSLTRGREGVVYENEGFRWELETFGWQLSYEWLYPPVIGDTITAGIRVPFRDLIARPAYMDFDKLMRGSGLRPAAQWTVFACALLLRTLFWAVLMALALQWIVAGLYEGLPSKHGFWRSTKETLRPMLAFGVILLAIAGISAVVGTLLRRAFPTVDPMDLDTWRRNLVHLVAFPLALTPFVIVGKRVGVLTAIVATFRLVATAWRQLLLILVLYRAGFVVVEFIGRMAWFIGEIRLLPPQLMRLDAPVLQSLRNMVISGVHPATLVGWIAPIASHWASSGLDLLLSTALMLLVLRTSGTGTVRPPECGGGNEN